MTSSFKRILVIVLCLIQTGPIPSAWAESGIYTTYRVPLDHPGRHLKPGERIQTVLGHHEVIISYRPPRYVGGQRLPQVNIERVVKQVPPSTVVGSGGSTPGAAGPTANVPTGHGRGGRDGKSGRGSGPSADDVYGGAILAYGTARDIAAAVGVSVAEAKKLSRKLVGSFDQMHADADRMTADAAEDARRGDEDLGRGIADAGRAAGQFIPPRPKAPVSPPGGDDGDEARCEITVGADIDPAALAAFVNEVTGDPKSSDYCRGQVDKFTNAEHVLVTARIAKDVDPSRLDDHLFATAPAGRVGRLVRDLANTYQTTWATNGGFKTADGRGEVFETGVSLLDGADYALAAGDEMVGRALWAASSRTLEILTGIKDGALAAARDVADVIPGLANALDELGRVAMNDAIGLIRGSQNVMTAIPEVRAAIERDLILSEPRPRDLTTYRRSALVGKVVTEVLIDYATDGVLGRFKVHGPGPIIHATRVNKAGRRAAIAARRIEKHKPELRGEWMLPSIDEADVARKAERLAHVTEDLAREGVRLTKDARRHLAGQLANETLLGKREGWSPAELKDIGTRYVRLEAKMKDVKLETFDGPVWRGIPKVYELPGPEPRTALHYDSRQVGDHTSHGYLANNRMSPPGRTGLYGVIPDKGIDPVGIIAAETRRPASQLHIESIPVSSKRVLNLRDPTTRERLGISTEDLVHPDSYRSTHAIAEAARRSGVEVIIFPNKDVLAASNIVLF